MDRRDFLKIGLGATAGMIAPRVFASGRQPRLLKPIPSTGEMLPIVGMGTSITFNIGEDPDALRQRIAVLRAFFDHGGGMIDSSPMYGSSEAVIGKCLRSLKPESGMFSASKVWTSSGSDGPHEMAQSRRLWGIERFDLMQVHNLLAWKPHLKTLFDMKDQGQLKYVGVTTSHGRRHDDLLQLMRDWPIDFVQASYNIVDREVEQRILPLAADRGIAFIANRPFRRGGLIDSLKKHPLPAWSAEFDCDDWACFLLKFIASHPAVTCAIPATRRVDHMRENMGAVSGRLPDAAMRSRMIGYVAQL